MTEWPSIHRDVVAAFATAWAAPEPHAWDPILDEDVLLAQPMIRTVRGRAGWWSEVARLLALLPDLRAEVLDWSGSEDRLFVHIRFTATLAGRPLVWSAVDVMRLGSAGTIVRRDSYFDPVLPVAAIARRPRAWGRWWRSGMSPFTARRALLAPR